MKQSNLKLLTLCLSMLCSSYALAESSASSCSNSCNVSKTTWLPRSFVSYLENDLFDTADIFYKDKNRCEPVIQTSFYTQYMQSFGGSCKSDCKNLGAMPFWSGTNTLTVGNNDGRAQLDAYQLGLGNVITNSDGIAGTITLNPKVQHFGTDMLLHYVHKPDQRSFYFKIHAPLGAMKITPHLTSTVIQPDDELNFTQVTSDPNSTTIDYQFLQYPVPARRQQSITEAFFGGVYDQKVFTGNLAKPVHLRKSRIAPASQTIIRLGDITASVGYNVFVHEKGFVGVAFKASMPTGNVPTANYALEPIFGRAGLWGVGLETSGVYKVWGDYSDRTLDLVLQAEILHLIPGRTPNYRTFDLKKNGPGSKYMLVQYYIGNYNIANTATTGTTEVETPQYLRQVADITTIPVVSKIAVEGSIALMLQGHIRDWNASLGAEFWGRSHECLDIDFVSAVDQRYQSLNDFAVLGRQVSAYQINGQGTLPTVNDSTVNGYYCEPAATISKSQDAVTLVGNPAIGGVTEPATLPAGIADARISSNRIPANVYDALDIAGAAASSVMTGKIFGTVGYTWSEHCHKPSLNLIAGAEFTSNTSNAVQLWNVGLQGSLQF